MNNPLPPSLLDAVAGPEGAVTEHPDTTLSNPLNTSSIDPEKIKKRIIRLESNDNALTTSAKTNRGYRKLEFSPQRSNPNDYKPSEDGISEEMSRTNPNGRLIPYRMIDAFINREKPLYQKYISEPTRIAIFTGEQEPTVNTQPLEEFFTSCFRYNGMAAVFMRCVDISQLHGVGYIEVRYDITKPGHFSFIAHRYEDIIYPPVDELSKCHVLYIKERFRYVDIVTLNISQSQKTRLIEIVEDEDKETFIFKVYVQTQTGWEVASYSKELAEFITPFKPLDNGFEGSNTILNLFTLVYDQNEELNLNDKKGRAYYDKDFQRAATVMISSNTEKHFKSGSVYAALTEPANRSSDAKALEIQLFPDTILDKPFTFFSPPEPSDSALNCVNRLETMHASSVGQVNFAANNRQDSRKTATELNNAAEMASLMSSVALGTFSGFMSGIIDFAWLILVDAVKNSEVSIPSTLTPADFLKQYYKRPAGDADYVKRNEKMTKMLQMLPMIINTPAGAVFINRLLDYAFPDEKFSAKLDTQAQQLELISALVPILKAFLASPNATNGIPPNELAAAQQLVATAEQDVAAGAQQMGLPPPQPSVPPNANQPTGPTPDGNRNLTIVP